MGNDRIGLHALDDDELLPTRGAGHETDGAPADAELIGDQPKQRLVRRSGDRGGRDVRPEDPVDHAVDMVGPRSRSQTDGEANVGVRQDSGPAPNGARQDPLIEAGG